MEFFLAFVSFPLPQYNCLPRGDLLWMRQHCLFKTVAAGDFNSTVQ